MRRGRRKSPRETCERREKCTSNNKVWIIGTCARICHSNLMRIYLRILLARQYKRKEGHILKNIIIMRCTAVAVNSQSYRLALAVTLVLVLWSQQVEPRKARKEKEFVVGRLTYEQYFEDAETSKERYWRRCSDDDVKKHNCGFQIPTCKRDLNRKGRCSTAAPFEYKCREFDASQFAQALSGKSLCLIGDSLVQQWSAQLSCLLSKVLGPARVEKDQSEKIWRLSYSNFTVAHIYQPTWNPNYYAAAIRQIGPCDVFMTGIGLWYLETGPFPNLDDTARFRSHRAPRGNLETYRNHLTWLMREAEDFSKEGKKVAFFEPSPQHFPWGNGEMNITAFFSTTDDKDAIHCVQHDTAPRNTLDIFQETAQKWHIPVVRIHEPLLSRWDMHEGRDCTHYCGSGAHDPAISGIYRWVTRGETRLC